MLHSHCGLKKRNQLAWRDVGLPQQHTATVVLENKMYNNFIYIKHAIKSVLDHVQLLSERQFEC